MGLRSAVAVLVRGGGGLARFFSFLTEVMAQHRHDRPHSRGSTASWARTNNFHPMHRLRTKRAIDKKREYLRSFLLRNTSEFVELNRDDRSSI